MKQTMSVALMIRFATARARADARLVYYSGLPDSRDKTERLAKAVNGIRRVFHQMSVIKHRFFWDQLRDYKQYPHTMQAEMRRLDPNGADRIKARIRDRMIYSVA
jgi:hypothetical protein